MRRALGHITLAAVLCTAALSACANGSNGSTFAPGDPAAPAHKPGTQTFKFTGGGQNFTVPAGVKSISVTGSGSGGFAGGVGGVLKATIPVTPGQTLAIFVGGQGGGPGSGGAPGAGGFNGGGGGGCSYSSCDGAGGGRLPTFVRAARA